MTRKTFPVALAATGVGIGTGMIIADVSISSGVPNGVPLLIGIGVGCMSIVLPVLMHR